MKNAVKWALVAVGGVVTLIILILLVLPFFVDAEKYKPLLENKVKEMTGRPFSVGGDVNLSFFPFVGVSFSDLHLGNPPGFEATDFISIKSFEVRVKVLPLLSRDVQVKRFVVKEPQIVLIKNKQSRGNWEFTTKDTGKSSPETAQKPTSEKPLEGLPIRSLTVGDFSVTKGSIAWIDKATDTRKTIDQLDLVLADLSFDRPIGLTLSARMDDKPVAVNGTVGPIGQDPGKATIPLNLDVKTLSDLALTLKGTVASPADNPRADLTVTISEFSPRKLLAQLGQSKVIDTADSGVLSKMSMQAAIAGGTDKISVSKGTMTLDDTRINFSARLAEFSRPDIAFEADLDRIDLDRYLPPKAEKTSVPASGARQEGQTTTGAPKPGGKVDKKKTDYTSFRRLVLDGKIKAGEVIVSKAKLTNFLITIRGKDGVLRVEPLQIDLYGGNLNLNGNMNVSQKVPRSTVKLQLKNVQAGPLVRDQSEKDFLEGTTNAAGHFSFSGDDAETVKKTLNGNGDLRFTNGAIKGIDLVAMIQNVTAVFGKGQAIPAGSQTDFTELSVPFAINNGVVETSQTKLESHVLDTLVVGKADLVSENLDFRVEPKVVRKLGRQQDEQKEYSNVTVPVLISGTFAAPKFAPDLESVAKQQIQQQIQEKLLESDKVQKYIEKKGLQKYEEPAKNLLKNLFK
ncbi:MAG: AsmA family protein [Desulfobacterales bacterium]|jgi:AsmA protein